MIVLGVLLHGLVNCVGIPFVGTLGLPLLAGRLMATTDLLFRRWEADNVPFLLLLECALVANNK